MLSQARDSGIYLTPDPASNAGVLTTFEEGTRHPGGDGYACHRSDSQNDQRKIAFHTLLTLTTGDGETASTQNLVACPMLAALWSSFAHIHISTHPLKVRHSFSLTQAQKQAQAKKRERAYVLTLKVSSKIADNSTCGVERLDAL